MRDPTPNEVAIFCVVLCVVVAAVLIGVLAWENNKPKTTQALGSYSSSATVGDFWTIDKTDASSLSWANLTAGTSGAATFTTDATGLMVFDANTGGLVNGVEIPGYSIVLSSTKAGPNSDSNAVILGMAFQDFSVSGIAGKIYTYMQFRCNNGGAECGTVSIDSESNSQANIFHAGYSPYSSLSGFGDTFSDNRAHPMAVHESDVSADKRFAIIQDTQSTQPDRVFKSSYGFAVDVQQGTLFGLPAADLSAFNSDYAGTYNTILYRKVVTGMTDNQEVGTSDVKAYVVTIGAGGSLAISGDLWSNSSLTSWVNSGPTKYGSSNWLKDDAIASECRGLFFAEATDAELFVAFVNSEQGTGCIINSVHNSGNTGMFGPTYEYFFGMGLKV
jgi:hypothetical protein